MSDFIKKYSDFLAIVILSVICILAYFWGIGAYPLMDVDETRYVSIAREMFNNGDYSTLLLNGDYFFEKPPLYFWLECISFKIFGHVNEFTARFPVALCATLSSFMVYFTGKKIVSRKFGFISALILTTSVEFFVLAKYSILDMVITSMIGISVLFGFLTQFVKEEHKRFFWWLFYIFAGLAVISKGLPGCIVPIGTMFFVTLFNKTFKQVFRPSYIVPGILLFLLIVLPWHIIMLNRYDPLFFNEYIMKHHINRFLTSSEIGREQPFYFYLITVFWGALPYIISVIAVGIAKLFKFNKIDFSNMTIERKFLWFNIIAFLVTFIFFTISSTKLITYILPVYFFTAFIAGCIWHEYIAFGKHARAINLTVYIMGSIFILVSVLACFAKYFIPEEYYQAVYSAKWFCIIMLTLAGIFSIVFALKKKPLGVLMTYILFVALSSAIGTKIFYNIDFKLGQNDLMKFATSAKQQNNNLYVINNPTKYSVLYYGKNIEYISINKEDETPDIPDDIFSEKTWAIIRNKEAKDISKFYKFDVIETGVKYSLVKFKH